MAAAGAVVVVDGHLLLVRRGGSPAAGRWAVPAGRIEPGEAPRAAAARETREETGLDVACRRVLIRLRLGVGGTTYDIVDFEAVPAGPAVDGLPRVRVGDDAAVVRWVPLGEVAELPLAPGMTGLVDRLAAGGGPG